MEIIYSNEPDCWRWHQVIIAQHCSAFPVCSATGCSITWPTPIRTLTAVRVEDGWPTTYEPEPNWKHHNPAVGPRGVRSVHPGNRQDDGYPTPSQQKQSARLACLDVLAVQISLPAGCIDSQSLDSSTGPGTCRLVPPGSGIGLWPGRES